MTTPSPGAPSAAGAITLVEGGPAPHLWFTGAIGRDVVREFRLAVRPADWPARVDLSCATALDPAALELLLHLARKQRRFGGELEVVEPPAQLRRTLEESGLTRMSHWVPGGTDAPPCPPGPGLGTAASA